jgi:cytochrome c
MKKSIFALASVGLMMSASAFGYDAAKGKEHFESNCSVCHNADSTETKMGPGLKGLFKRAELTNKKKVSDATVLEKINEGGNGMPGFADILSKAEKDDLILYLKSL